MSNEIQNKLSYLIETKRLIKQTLIGTGSNVDDSTPFRKYPEEISKLALSLTEQDGDLMQCLDYVYTALYGNNSTHALEEYQNLLPTIQYWMHRHLQGV